MEDERLENKLETWKRHRYLGLPYNSSIEVLNTKDVYRLKFVPMSFLASLNSDCICKTLSACGQLIKRKKYVWFISQWLQIVCRAVTFIISLLFTNSAFSFSFWSMLSEQVKCKRQFIQKTFCHLHFKEGWWSRDSDVHQNAGWLLKLIHPLWPWKWVRYFVRTSCSVLTVFG